MNQASESKLRIPKPELAAEGGKKLVDERYLSKLVLIVAVYDARFKSGPRTHDTSGRPYTHAPSSRDMAQANE